MVFCWVRGNEYVNFFVFCCKSMCILVFGGSVGINGIMFCGSVIVVFFFDDLEKQKDSIVGKIVVYNQVFVFYDKIVEYCVFGVVCVEFYGVIVVFVRLVMLFGI